ncbi:MAG: hypothetical protein JWP76_3598 [Dactylosporangium sp.]|jgi:hypothetical protein|nr:hypothetical protein [Dactylosporangium sp.]
MSEDWKLLNTRGRHSGYETVELEPINDDLLANANDVDLESDPFAEDLSAELTARAPRRYVTRTTVALAGLVLAVGGFLAGAHVQKSYGTPANAAAPGGTGAAGFAGGAFGGRQGGQNAAPGTGGQNGAAQTGAGRTGGGSSTANATTGTVKLVDGTTVYVQTPDGSVVTVKTNGSTAVQTTQNGALTDLTPGAQVSVEGPAASDGTVSASKVTKVK